MITFRIPDMTCARCASAITRAVASVDKHVRVETHIPEKLVQLVGAQVPKELLAAAIQGAGYTVEQQLTEPLASAPGQARGGCCCRTTKPPIFDPGQPVTSAIRSCC